MLACRAGADFKDDIRNYLGGSERFDCGSLHGELENQQSSWDNPRNQVWFWPVWLYLAAECSDAPSHDAPLSLEAAQKLLAGGKDQAALVCALLGAHCYMQASQWAKADELLRWAREEGIQPARERGRVEEWIDQLQAYWASEGGLYSRVRGMRTMPNLIVAPVDVRRMDAFSDDREAGSIAVTWLLNESMRRILAGGDTLLSGLRLLTVEEDLALRSSSASKRSCATRDTLITKYGMKYHLPVYLLSLLAGKSTFFHAYLSADGAGIHLTISELLEGKIPRTEFPKGATAHNASSLPLLHDLPGLALATANGMLSLATGVELPEAPAEARVFPRGEALFFLLTEAAGFEARGNCVMAARRYEEILESAPDGTPDSQLEFVRRRLRHCQDLAAFDDPRRFLKNNQKELRELLRSFMN